MNDSLFSFSVIFCEAVAIYGVIVAIILQTKLETVSPSQIYAPESLRAGYSIFASGIIVGFANLVCGFDPSSQNIFLSRMKKKTHQLKILIRRYILFVKVVCRDYWQQLCIIWCPKLISFCKDSRDRDFWKRARFIWYNCRNNHVCSSYMAWKGSLVCQLLLNLRICGSRSGGLLTFFLLFPMGLYV